MDLFSLKICFFFCGVQWELYFLLILQRRVGALLESLYSSWSRVALNCQVPLNVKAMVLF